MLYRPRLAAVAALTLAAVLPFTRSARADEAVVRQHAVVIAGHPEATRLGLKVLQDGGNAIDALVTTSLSLGVVEPGNSGLGGKFVMLYYEAKTGRVTCEVALNAAPLHTPVDAVCALPVAERDRGWKSICTPGLAAALGEAHKKWGTKPWPALLKPAIDLARRGMPLNPTAADMLGEFPVGIDPVAGAIYAPAGKTLTQGQVLRNPDLAATMQVMADKGYRAFYTGEIAKKLIAAADHGGGYLSADDLANYQPRFLDPLKGEFEGKTVYTSPPPLTGGTTLLASLECLQSAELATVHPRDSAYIDLIGRVLRQVYPATTTAAADVPDSIDRVNQVLSAASIASMWDRAQNDGIGKTLKKKVAAVDLKGPFADEAFADATEDDTADACTTHLIIVDAQGNIACVTQSLGLHFGSGCVAAGTGVLFNGDISNFGVTTKTSPNYIAPGKWPRSTMTPTIFLQNGKPLLAIGSPAGQRIPTAVLQVSLDVLHFGEDLKDAIRAPRFHVRRAAGKADPANLIDIESAAAPDLENELDKIGWQVERRKVHDFYFGSVNAVQWQKDGSLLGVADQRRTSDAGGE